MADKKRDYSEFIHIKEVIESIITQCRRESNEELAKIRRAWNRMMPQEISEHAQPAALKNDTLLIHVCSSTVTHQLRFLVEEIKQNLNESGTAYPINAIKFKVGKV